MVRLSGFCTYVLIEEARKSCYKIDFEVDFRRLFRIHTQGSFFVTRVKDNIRFKLMYSNAVDKTTGVQFDQISKLETFYSKKDYPDKLRRIKYYDEERKKDHVFITNNINLKATEIAML